MARAMVRVTRRYEPYGMLRGLRLVVDDRPVGKIGNGKTFAFMVPPGRYAFQVKMDWLRSPPLTVEIGANEIVDLHTEVSRAMLTLHGTFLGSLVSPSRYFILEHVETQISPNDL